jgi:hypothetical protein
VEPSWGGALVAVSAAGAVAPSVEFAAPFAPADAWAVAWLAAASTAFSLLATVVALPLPFATGGETAALVARSVATVVAVFAAAAIELAPLIAVNTRLLLAPEAAAPSLVFGAALLFAATSGCAPFGVLEVSLKSAVAPVLEFPVFAADPSADVAGRACCAAADGFVVSGADATASRSAAKGSVSLSGADPAVCCCRMDPMVAVALTCDAILDTVEPLKSI